MCNIITTVASALTVSAMTFGCATVMAVSYPDKPVTIVVPYPPGGGADTLARIVAQKMGERLKQTVIVENKPGANTIIATEHVARQLADGYTLLYVASSFSINPSLYKLNYDTRKAFAPVGLIAQVPLMLVANKQFPASIVSQLIDYAMQRPGKVTFASYGTGSPAHLAGELFKSMTGVDILHVPYKGSSQALTDMMGGHVDISFSSMPPALGLVKADELKSIAVTTRRRTQGAPNVPTVDESGVSGFEATGWNGLVAPAGTPLEIISTLNRVLNDIVSDPAVAKQLVDGGYEPDALSVAQFQQLIHTEIDKWGKVIQDVHIVVN